MKSKNYWSLGLLIGVLLIIVPLVSAFVAVTGAFGSDPSETANRIDFAWAAAGLIIAAYSFYRIRQLSKS